MRGGIGSSRAKKLVAMAREDARNTTRRPSPSQHEQQNQIFDRESVPESPAPHLSEKDVVLMNNMFSTVNNKVQTKQVALTEPIIRAPPKKASASFRQAEGPQSLTASAAIHTFGEVDLPATGEFKNMVVMEKPVDTMSDSISENPNEQLPHMLAVSQNTGPQSQTASVPINPFGDVDLLPTGEVKTMGVMEKPVDTMLDSISENPNEPLPHMPAVSQNTGNFTGAPFYLSPSFGAPTAECVGVLQLDLNDAGSTTLETFSLLPGSSVDAIDNNNNDSIMDLEVLGETPTSSCPAMLTGMHSTTPPSPEINPHLKSNVVSDATCRRELFPVNEDSGTMEGVGDWEDMQILDSDSNGDQILRRDVLDDMGVIDKNIQSDPASSDNVDALMEPAVREPEVTPPVTRKRRQPVPVTNSPRKRKKNTVCWKSSVAKAAHNAGQAYVNWRGKEMPAKEIGPGCSPATCKRNCHELVSMEEREKLFNSYYSIADASRKWDFIVRLVQKVSTARPTVGDSSRRSNTYKYTIHQSDGEIKTVCQKFFLDTIDQSHQVIKTAHAKLENGLTNLISPDKRGRHNKKSTIKPQIKSSVREHIASFKTVESHYCRKTSKYQYLPENLNVRKMHSMYVIERNNAPHTANLRQYRDIFNNEFNLKFLKLKKDRCSQCENWKHRTPAEKSAPGEQEKFDMHIANKKKGEELKKQDSLRVKTEEHLCVASFDFQKILYCPKGENAAYFYRNKFKCFDFTIFDHRTKEGRCYVWDQTIASKGANEVASCLLLFIEEKAKEGIREIVFYSDNCWSQNKNTKVLSMMNLASVKFGITITHRFLEKGHTHMEVDNVHACIENRSRNLDIFTPGQWYAIIKSAKINDPKYKVIEMEQKSFMEFKDLAAHHKWNLGITKLREIVLTANNAYFKHNYDDEASNINPLPARPGRPVNLPTFRLKPAYTGKFAVPANIVEDLKWYCDQGHIPTSSQPYFRSLFDTAQGVQGEVLSDSEFGVESDSEPDVQGDSD